MSAFQSIPFPVRGFTENEPYGKADLSTTDDALNVIVFDSDEDRARGGQRWGNQRYIDEAVNGTNPVQDMNKVVRVLDSRAVVPDEEEDADDFEDGVSGTDVDDDLTWEEYGASETAGTHANPFKIELTGGSRVVEYLDVAGDIKIQADWGELGSTNQDNARGLLRVDSDYDDKDKYVIRVKVTTFVGEISTGITDPQYWAGIAFRIKPGSSDGEYFFAGWVRPAGEDEHRIVLRKQDGTTVTDIDESDDLGANDTDEHELEVRVNKNYVEVFWDGVRRAKGKTNGFTSDDHKNVGLVFKRRLTSGNWQANDTPYFDDFQIFSATNPSSFRSTELIVVSGGTIKSANREDDTYNSIVGGTDALASDVRHTMSAVLFQQVFFVDGFNYKFYDPTDGDINDWDNTDASGTNKLPGGNGAEGANGSGTPDGNARCRIICPWQGRIVLSGKQDDPHNVFMSRIGDAFEFIESVSGSDANPFVFNEATFGQIGEVVTAVIPYNDDNLVIGMDASIAVLSGNPSSGAAVLQSLTRDIGVISPRAWAVGPNKIMYFAGTDGLYQISPNQFNIDQGDRISAGRLDKTFGAINRETHSVQLAWDVFRHGLHIYITPEASGSAEHWFWDHRANSFWPVQYPNDHGPTSVYVYDADAPTDRAVLIGGFDSYVRDLDDSIKNDDGVAINSYIYIGPLMPGDPMLESKLTRIKALLDEGSDDVSVSVHVGDTAELALGTSAVFTNTISAGRNDPINNRARGYAMYLKLANSTISESWQLESLAARLVGGGYARVRS